MCGGATTSGEMAGPLLRRGLPVWGTSGSLTPPACYSLYATVCYSLPTCLPYP